MKRFILFALAVINVFLAFGQAGDDTVKVLFHIGSWRFDPSLENNAASMNYFIESVRAASRADGLDRVVIRAYASPDGADRLNERLSKKRTEAIADLIATRAGISRSQIEALPQGVAWDELRKLVEETPGVPSREKILQIIDHTPIYVYDRNGRVVDGRKKQLMDLRGGRPYKWMLRHLFPKLRNAVAVSICLKNSGASADEANLLTDIADIPIGGSGQSGSETDSVALTPEFSSTSPIELIGEVNDSGDAGTEAVDSETIDSETIDSETIDFACVGFEGTPMTWINPSSLSKGVPIALKTNLLYYGILMPNLELEWLINRNWSVALEGNVAWWGRYSKNKSYRLAVIDAEVRRWIKPRSPWHGMYVGVIAGGGWYDLLKKSPGKRGEGLMTGLSFGYMWPLGRHLSLDAEIGAGYVYTRYKEYDPVDGHHLYLRTRQLNYFGPIKLKFSIVWRFLEGKNIKIANKEL